MRSIIYGTRFSDYCRTECLDLRIGYLWPVPDWKLALLGNPTISADEQSYKRM